MDVQRRVRVADVADEYVFRSDARLKELMRHSLTAITQEPSFGIEAQETGRVPGEVQAALSDLLTTDVLEVRLSVFGAGGQLERTYMATPGRPATEAGSIVGSDQPSRTGQQDGFDSDDEIDMRPLAERPLAATQGYTATLGTSDGGLLVLTVRRRHVSSPRGALFGHHDWRQQISIAEFVDGTRVRTEGEDFERYTLPDEVVSQLENADETWQRETVYGRPYLTFYRRYFKEPGSELEQTSIVAVRTRAVISYDHLYYLLRLALASLWPGLVLYALGLVFRSRGARRRHRTRFSDRVLDTFLGIGTVAVIAMGLLGQHVITRENEGAIRSRLERRLQRMENALIQRAGPAEPLYEVLRRVPLDSLSKELSLDLSVYSGPWLTDVSQNQEEALPMIGKKLPIQAFDELYLQRFRQSFVESEGERGYVYTIGYKALADDDGHPRAVVAVLTIPEQARIREERARTTAYLFGALLLLLLAIMATATVLAGALSRPIRRLRDGLEAVAQGKFQQPLPVPSRDEVGELVETFNVMQDQLVDSRRKLAQQQREMAWRAMARQVAHEIKNPLTPMKLSIQHLQRAFAEQTDDDPGRFKRLFQRITATLSEQIDALANIANEFSTFARMPKRHPEFLDANTILGEAISLLQTQQGAAIEFAPEEEPLVVLADHDELRRVYINVLKNASEAAGNRGRVVVRTRSDVDEASGTRVLVSEIVDNGPGIPAELRDRIFEPNFSTKTSGMGLGLAIARKSVEDMQGEIGFVTNPGRGTTFWIRLPLADG
jgi:signal transduction histidine kinase